MNCFKDVVLDHTKKEHLYIQLYKQLRMRIIDGRLLPDEKLPPIRAYALDLGVNNVTVVNAYKLLEQQGLVYKKVGSGTYVRDQAAIAEVPQLEQINNDMPGQVALQHGINMASTTPSEYLFPVDQFKVAINEVLDRDKGGAFGYQDVRGYQPLREALCPLLKTHYQIETTEDAVQILSGAQQGLDVISKAIVQYGDVVIVEGPTYTGAIATFKSRGAKLLELPLEDDGPNIMKLKELIYQYKPKLLYVMPNYQNPTGIVYSDEKKRELLDLAKKHRFYIIEDDYCSELAYNHRTKTPLKAIDAEDSVIYIKSFSKAMMPGLRLGLMLTPKALQHHVTLAKQSTDVTTSGLTQRAFDYFIRTGGLEGQKDYMYQVFEGRYQAAKEAIEKYLTGICTWKDTNGGLHFWLKIETGISSKRLYEQLKSRGVLIASGDAFFVSRTETPYLRLTIASVEVEDLVYGIRVMADILKQETASPPVELKMLL